MNLMLSKELHSPHVRALAERLLTDIRHRGLTVGDRYLTTEEVGQTLGVGKAAASKAMRHLAQRQILISRQRSGTFIGPGVHKHRRSQVRTIYVLLPAGNVAASHWSYNLFIQGIQKAISSINVQFTFVPEIDSVAYVGELLESSRSAGQLAGVVAISCPPDVYRYLADLGVSAVVYGSLYAHSADLPIASVDMDAREAGRLLTQYLLDHGHRRMALLMAGGGRPGDNAFFDGISAALTGAALPHNALVQRLVPNSIEALQATARDLFEDSGHPTGIITHGSEQALAVVSVASDLGLAVPDDVEIVFDHEDQTMPRIDVTPYPHVLPKLPFVDIAETIGKMLKEMSDGGAKRARRVLIPVELHGPERNVFKIA